MPFSSRSAMLPPRDAASLAGATDLGGFEPRISLGAHE
jgi:hypothetical protein